VLGWTSPALPFLEKDGGPLGSPINSEQSSWIGSLVPLGAIIGSFISGYIGERYIQVAIRRIIRDFALSFRSELGSPLREGHCISVDLTSLSYRCFCRWGRKRSLLSSVIPFLIGWMLVASASQVVHLYVARLMLGIGLAFPFTILPMYCGEIAEVNDLVTFMQITLLRIYDCSVIFADLHQRSAGIFPSALHHVRLAVYLRHRAVRQLHGVLDRLCHPAGVFLPLLHSNARVTVLSSHPGSQRRSDRVSGEASKQIQSSRPERSRRDTGEAIQRFPQIVIRFENTEISISRTL